MWTLEGVGKILGVKVALPVLDGFRLVFKDGSIKEVKYVKKKFPDGYVYKFMPAVELKGDDEAKLQIHTLTRCLFDMRLLTEPKKWIKEVRFHIGDKGGFIPIKID